MSKHTSHVLLVDDNAVEIQPLVNALRKLSCRLTAVRDGIQGYAQAVSKMPDIILMEVHVPRRDGIATTRLLKANQATEHIPVLLLATTATLDERLEGLRAGALDYIFKPFEPEEVVEKVRNHLSLGQRLTAPCSTTSIASACAPAK